MKAHRTDGLSLTFGLVFLAIVVWWLVAQSVDLSLPHLGWFVAGALIVLGLLGLFGALRSGGELAPARVPEAADAADAAETAYGPDEPVRAPDQPLRADEPVRAPEQAEDRTETDLFDSRGEGETGRP